MTSVRTTKELNEIASLVAEHGEVRSTVYSWLLAAVKAREINSDWSGGHSPPRGIELLSAFQWLRVNTSVAVTPKALAHLTRWERQDYEEAASS